MLIEEIRINRKSVIRWYRENNDEYRVEVKVYNREVYNKRLDRKHFEIYHNYINERVKYLIGEGILYKEYSMILIDNTMYKVLDNFHFMELVRFMVPVDGLEEYKIEDNLFDLVLDATMRTGEIYDDTDLVYHNGIFYTNGMNIGNIKDFDRVGIEYEQYDLLNGLNMEQGDYLFYKMYYSLPVIKVKNYVSKNVRLKIDR